MKNRFQNSHFKCNLQRYIKGGAAAALGSAPAWVFLAEPAFAPMVRMASGQLHHITFASKWNMLLFIHCASSHTVMSICFSFNVLQKLFFSFYAAASVVVVLVVVDAIVVLA